MPPTATTSTPNNASWAAPPRSPESFGSTPPPGPGPRIDPTPPVLRGSVVVTGSSPSCAVAGLAGTAIANETAKRRIASHRMTITLPTRPASGVRITAVQH